MIPQSHQDCDTSTWHYNYFFCSVLKHPGVKFKYTRLATMESKEKPFSSDQPLPQKNKSSPTEAHTTDQDQVQKTPRKGEKHCTTTPGDPLFDEIYGQYVAWAFLLPTQKNNNNNNNNFYKKWGKFQWRGVVLSAGSVEVAWQTAFFF